MEWIQWQEPTTPGIVHQVDDKLLLQVLESFVILAFVVQEVSIRKPQRRPEESEESRP
jgi:hypothetical protein